MKRIFTIFLLILLVACQANGTVDASGSAELSVEPDMVEIYLGVSIVDDSADKAQSQVNNIMSEVVSSLSSYEIETQQLSLYEEYDYTQEGRKSNGWRATQTVKVTSSDLTKVGEIIDAGVAAGINRIQSVNFKLSEEKEQEYKQQALIEATQNAKKKAEGIASGLNAELGKVVSVSEGDFNFYPVMRTFAEDSAGIAEAKAVVPESDVTVSARVSIVYEIK